MSAKSLIIALLAVGSFANSTVSAQTLPDSTITSRPDSINLGEVTVTAAPVIRKADRDVYVPSQQVKERSSDGMSLLQNLQIPSIFVNSVLESITVGGDDVQLRINGREATIREIKALDPASITRVEYLDDPGLRYKGAKYVLNYIVRNPTVGGSLMVNGMQALTAEISNAFVSGKLNHGRSQWGVQAFANNNGHLKMEQSTDNTYRLSDRIIERNTFSDKNSMSSTWLWTYLYYNYLVPDKTNIYVNFNGGFMPHENQFVSGMTTGTDIASLITNTDSHQHATYPQASFYIDHKLKPDQTLVFNVDFGWRNENGWNSYKETEPVAGTNITDIFNRTRTRNFDINSEFNYIKEWKKFTLTVGASYYIAWLKTNYIEPQNITLRSREQDVYGFGELTARLGKFTLTGGLGLSNDHVSPGTGDSYNHFMWRPRFSASYRLNDYNRFRATFSASNGLPSNAQMSDVVSEVDGFQISTGNPGLRSYAVYDTRFTYMYTHPRVSVQFDFNWSRSPGRILGMDYLNSDNKIVNTYSNQSASELRFSLAPRVVVIPDWLTVSGRVNLNRYFMRGENYRNLLTSVGGNYGVELTHWNFTLMAQGFISPKRLSGQQWHTGERIHMLMLSYKYKNLDATFGLFNPFNKFSTSNGTMGAHVDSYNSITTTKYRCVPFIHLSYNLQWGYQKRSKEKLIEGSEPEQKGGGVGIM